MPERTIPAGTIESTERFPTVKEVVKFSRNHHASQYKDEAGKYGIRCGLGDAAAIVDAYRKDIGAGRRRSARLSEMQALLQRIGDEIAGLRSSVVVSAAGAISCPERELAEARAEIERLREVLNTVLADGRRGGSKPTIQDLCFTVWNIAKKPNAEDGGESDWFNDTLPVVESFVIAARSALTGGQQ